MSTELDPTWAGLVDDAATFPPGEASLDDAIAAHEARTPEEGAGLVGSFVVRDTDLPRVRDLTAPVSVVVTGGAGQVVGPAALCARMGLRVVGLEVALRDLDDLPGNARRVTAAVDAARDGGALPEDVPVYVELPAAASDHGWLTAGLHHAVRHTDALDGLEHHGFLNLLLATRAAFDGEGDQVVRDLLAQTDGPALVVLAREAGDDLARARRWLASIGSCDAARAWADLRELGLVA